MIYPELFKFTRIICHIIGHNTYAEFWYWLLYTNFQNFGKLYRIRTWQIQNCVTCPVKLHSTQNMYMNSVCRYSTLDSVQNSGRAREFWTIIIQNSVDLTVRHCTGYRILSRVQMFWTVRRIRKRILYHVTRILYHVTRILYRVTRILSYVQNTGKVYQNSGKVVQNSGKRCPEFLNYPEWPI